MPVEVVLEVCSLVVMLLIAAALVVAVVAVTARRLRGLSGYHHVGELDPEDVRVWSVWRAERQQTAGQAEEPLPPELRASVRADVSFTPEGRFIVKGTG